MHLTRAKASKRLPIPRKGIRHIVKASSHGAGVPVVIAIRDMLGLAKTSKEVREMIKDKQIKLNGKVVKDHKESVRLFNILEAGKKYQLTILKTGRFVFKETKEVERLCKVVGKTLLKDKKTQLNFHDGTNVIASDKLKVGDSVKLDDSGKIIKTIKFENGKKAFVISGGSVGLEGKIEGVDGNEVKIKLEDKIVGLKRDHIVVM